MGLREWIIGNKLLVFCALAAACFCVSTIVLGVVNMNLKSDRRKQKEQEGEGGIINITSNIIHKPYDMSKYRLPPTIRPKKYDLFLYPNLESGNYTGRVVTTVNVSKPTDVITLHSKGLSIKSAKVDGEEAATNLDEQYELLNLRKKSGKNVEGKNSIIEIDFEGTMANRLVGLYRSTYKGAKGLR